MILPNPPANQQRASGPKPGEQARPRAGQLAMVPVALVGRMPNTMRDLLLQTDF